MKKYRIRVGLDVDDTLYECNSYAVAIINRRHPDEEPLRIEEIKSWGGAERHGDERIALYSDPEFVRTQPITEGAQEFVKKLSEIADVFFVTAVPARCMSARAERLVKDFPEIPAQNIIMGTRKDIISLEIMLDDGAHNISSSRAAYPVLYRKPWNTGLSGLLSVNSYDDFLHFCEMVRNSFSESFPKLSEGGVLCLVGPSGSSKTEIAGGLTKLEEHRIQRLSLRHFGEGHRAHRQAGARRRSAHRHLRGDHAEEPLPPTRAACLYPQGPRGGHQEHHQKRYRHRG